MRRVAYLGMDVHAQRSVLGDMNGAGKFLGNVRFGTSEQNIIAAIKAVPARKKYLTMEEGPLARWVAQIAHPYVTEVVVCDPRENWLISRSSRKWDKIDTKKLCRLLRLGELKTVYQPESDDRAIFKAAAQHYIDLRNQQVALKLKIKSMYRHWGVVDVSGGTVYSPKRRNEYLSQVKHLDIQNQLIHLYKVMDMTEEMEALALKNMKRLGRKYPEIRHFKKIPGIGDVCSHVFDAFIQTPDRFAHKRKVWRYSKLGITDRSSDGKPLGYKRLDKSGVSELKDISHTAWRAAMCGSNEVKQFYLRSLQRTGNHVHARLNTQRKILAVMYGMWKGGEAYRPKLFLDSSN